MSKEVMVNGREFKLSSMCNAASTRCCAVSINSDDIAMLNTTNCENVIHFTKDEWVAFIDGVKNGEFDV